MVKDTFSLNDLTIGSGALFPIELSKDSKGKTSWNPVKGDKRLIEHNLVSLFVYQVGERLREEEFGTTLWEIIEEPDTQAQSYFIYRYLKDVIDQYENRITFREASLVNKGMGQIELHLYYNLGNQEQHLTATYNL